MKLARNIESACAASFHFFSYDAKTGIAVTAAVDSAGCRTRWFCVCWFRSHCNNRENGIATRFEVLYPHVSVQNGTDTNLRRV
jgi:hypothetical protein